MKFLYLLLTISIISFISCSISAETPKCYNHNDPKCIFTTCKTNKGCDKGEYCEPESEECMPSSDFCKDINCNNGGYCSVKDNKPICECTKGFIRSGLRCIPENLCDSIYCGNGKCEIKNGDTTCNCNEGYYYNGIKCKKDLCFNIACKNGSCSFNENNSAQCICSWGYGNLENDKLKCVDLCENISCAENENCVLGECIENSSFCSENNICINEQHCWDTFYNEDLIANNDFKTYEMPSCKQVGQIFVIPKGQKWHIEINDLPSNSRVFVYDSHFLSKTDFTPLFLSNISNNGLINFNFTASQSGEHIILIERNNVFSTDSYRIKANCTENCSLNSTRYPVVLVHGYAGTDSYFGIADYFWKVRDTLTEKGYLVFTPETNPIDESEDRAIQLSSQIDEILKDTGAIKVNLIAHSQGGLDSRVLISGLGYADVVASLTTIGTPHHGIGIPGESLFSIQDFSPEYAENIFNPRYPNIENVKYWSYSSRTCGALKFSCQDESNGEKVNILLATSHIILRNKYGDNDGVVPTYSMVWGEHIRMLFADHFDEIGQIFDNDSKNDAFRHLEFYENEMIRLKNYGF